MKLRSSVAWFRLQRLLVWAGLTGLFLFAFVLLLVAIPVLLGIGLGLHIGERRFLRRLRRTGRIRPWAEIRVHMAKRQGTLVLEADRELGQVRRAWWLPDHLVKLFPTAPWTGIDVLRRLTSETVVRLEPSDASREWCEHFLPRFASAAVLTEVSAATLWSYLNSPACAADSVAVVPFPVLTFDAKRAN